MSSQRAEIITFADCHNTLAVQLKKGPSTPRYWGHRVLSRQNLHDLGFFLFHRGDYRRRFRLRRRLGSRFFCGRFLDGRLFGHGLLNSGLLGGRLLSHGLLGGRLLSDGLLGGRLLARPSWRPASWPQPSLRPASWPQPSSPPVSWPRPSSPRLLSRGFFAAGFLAAAFFAGFAGEDFFSNAMRASFFAGAALLAALTAATFGLPITFLLAPAAFTTDEGFLDWERDFARAASIA